jgi:hypothetical protein
MRPGLRTTAVCWFGKYTFGKIRKSFGLADDGEFSGFAVGEEKFVLLIGFVGSLVLVFD